MGQPKTPMYKKLFACRADRLVISQFLEWMETHLEQDEEIRNLHNEKLIMEYFDIDEISLENERRAILDYQREEINARWPQPPCSY